MDEKRIKQAEKNFKNYLNEGKIKKTDELDEAWNEHFKDKPNSKNDDEEDREFNPYIRHCPEGDDWELEVTGDANVYECNNYGYVWKRLRPLNDGTENLINMLEKLKKMISKTIRWTH
ncbi:hypothetical protein COU61_04040 [Candidatus Pacearchaeota archaeon CG10_big_fil_rev_8_21_14_0_10_35_13]|nr:MAG: hypothetical protein COU61_04040 [Candidatus Pacearchaeota archaeon CG10_big_fil_rev_8_21_14_0_10_35_13]